MALGDIGRRTGRIAQNDLDFPARDRIAVDLEVGLDARFHLASDVGKRPRKSGDDAYLDRFLRGRGSRG